MKTKLTYLIVLGVFATLGVVVFQIIWLRNSYQLSRDKITSEAKVVLDEAIVEHKELVAKRVRRLLIKAINPKDIETEVHWQMPDSLNVGLDYRTKLYPNSSWYGFKVSIKDLSKVQRNPYPLLLKTINEGNLDVLNAVYSNFIGIVDYEPNSLEDRLQDSLMRCFYLHEDTASLNKIIKKRFKNLNHQFAIQVIHQKGIEEVYNQESVLNKTLHHESDKVVEMVITKKKSTTLTAQLDSLNNYFQNINKQGNRIYVAKPILDDINDAFRNKISVIILVVNITPSIILQQMLFSLIGSFLLLMLIGFCLSYMVYTILKQKKLSAIKDDFISNVSHELKTPVATTLAAIQGMQHFEVLKDKDKTNQYLATAEKEMYRLATMIDTILNSAIYERSDFSLNLVRFNFKEMLEEMISVLELHAKKEVKIKFDYQGKEEVLADKIHLYNVFINLIDNAIKYGNDRVNVLIEFVNSDDGIKILVSDNGNGIPMVYQKNIFDKFFRVPSPIDHSVKGYGLGLNYVKSIIEKHNGSIKLAKSDASGSTFEINMPK